MKKLLAIITSSFILTACGKDEKPFYKGEVSKIVKWSHSRHFGYHIYIKNESHKGVFVKFNISEDIVDLYSVGDKIDFSHLEPKE